MVEALIGLASFLGGVCVTLFGFVLPFSNKLTMVCTQLESFKVDNANQFKSLRDALNAHINSPPRECLVHDATLRQINEVEQKVAILTERIKTD